jgi:RNA-directed DNA polymerase
MVAAQIAKPMSPQLVKIAERARRDSSTRFNSLAHLIDVNLLRSAYKRLRKGAAVGVDQVTYSAYGEALEENLHDLHERMRSQRYRHQPIRRVHIFKAPDKTRPIGVSTIEDKIVQTAVRDVLEAIYEVDFLDFSYGFRRGRRAHDALRDMRKAIDHGEVNVVLEADLQEYFDRIDRTFLKEFLQTRIADKSFLRLIGKCLRVGILDNEQYDEPEVGTVQGSTLSPMLGNIFLHYVLDVWFEREVRPRMLGKVHLWRFADDFVIGFQKQEDADRVMKVLGKRMAKYGLTLHPEKTRIVDFKRPPRNPPGGKGKATFDFLGFCFLWKRTRHGNWAPNLRTRTARLHRATNAVNDFCRRHRNKPVAEQHAGLVRRLRGHYNYFAVQGNFDQLAVLYEKSQRIWHKWLNRRSQRSRMNWERFADLMQDLPLPRPRIMVKLWG